MKILLTFLIFNWVINFVSSSSVHLPWICDNVRYNISTRLCCEGKLHTRNSWSQTCCGQASYDSYKDQCCNGAVFKHANRCCNGIGYRRYESICCNGKLYDGPGFKSCCGGIGYNTRTHTCCNRKTIHRRLTEVCCDGSVHPSPYRHYTACCGKKTYSGTERCCNGNIYDTTFEKCVNGKEIQPLATPKSAICRSSGSEKGTAYVPFRDVCCDGRVFRDSTTCCNGRVGYHPGRAACCDGVVYDGMDRCCDGKGYFSSVQGCCGGKIYRHGQEICCNKQVNEVKSAAQFCCGKGTYDRNFDACCGEKQFQSMRHCCNGIGVPYGFSKCCSSPGGKRIVPFPENC